jgi:hypothetical protein
VATVEVVPAATIAGGDVTVAAELTAEQTDALAGLAESAPANYRYQLIATLSGSGDVVTVAVGSFGVQRRIAAPPA